MKDQKTITTLQVAGDDIITVGIICQKVVLTCAPETSLADAAKAMHDAACSSIVIVEGQIPVGIWTERDTLVLDYNDNKALERPIAQVMSRPVLSVRKNTSVGDAGIYMKRERIRHLLVVDEEGELFGIVSQTDIIMAHGVEHYLLMRDVKSVLTKAPLFIQEDTTVNDVSKLLATKQADAAIITDDNGNPVGIITERDLIKQVSKREINKPVGQFASKPIRSVPMTYSLLKARSLLEKEGIRHLAITGIDGSIIGILSLADILSNIEYEYVSQLQNALEERDAALINSEKNLKLAQRVINASLDGIIITDAKGVIQSVNPAFTTVTGYEREEVIGQTPRILASGRHDDKFYEDMWVEITEKGRWQGEIWNRRKNGEIYPEWLTITAVDDKDGKPTQFAGIFSDITERKKNEERIKNLAFFDMLTGIPNRRLFNDRLSIAIANAHRHDHKLGLLFLDLDMFKRINDSLGHTAGDEILKEMASRLKSCLREGDTLSRLGGDEFMILQAEIEEAEDSIKLARRINEKVSEPFHVDGNELQITTSIGISIYPFDGETNDQLIKNADTAMYRAKDLGRNSYQMYTAAMNAEALEKLALETSLNRAIQNDELFLNYQVKVDLDSGLMSGIEALVRWNHPDLGLIAPSDFIPVAEETGRIKEIGYWVLKKACQQNKDWLDRGLKTARMAVNVAAKQFTQPDFVEQVIGILDETGLEPSMLELELTESTLMERVDEVIAMLARLREIGVKVSIDDFGTGYSSFGYLKHIPVDTLKIDASFIRDMSHEDDAEIVSAIIAMAHKLKLRVVAEGVELESQMEFLRIQNCDEIQGFLISRPLSADNMESLFNQNLLPELLPEDLNKAEPPEIDE